MTDNEKLDLILKEVLGMKAEIQDMKANMQGMKNDMQGMKDELQDMKDGMQGMKNDIQGMKDDMQGMKDDMQNMKDELQQLNQRITKIELLIENEIRVNIRRVAEGHLDLSRNLHSAMKPNSEVEMLTIRVNRLESDVKELKAKLA